MVARRPAKLAWTEATVAAAIAESETARTIALDVPGWRTHRAGQHLDMRLTAPDGYQATRSYSISSAPGEDPQITVERTIDGEVSPFLVDVVEIGDTLEVRGPVGGYFVWDPGPTPLLLIGGGSGIAPLRAMWRAAPVASQVTVLYSARDRSRVIFAKELAARDGVTIHLTRSAAPGFVAGRIGPAAVAAAVAVGAEADVFVCGPTSFVETMTTALATVIDDRRRVRVERFG